MKEALDRTVLTLVRHGQTAANLDAVWHGSSDTPLTPHGEKQAQCVADFLADHGSGATAVYSSPLARARNTAQPIAERLGLSIRVEEELSEYDIGEWEGKSFKELHEVHQLWHHIGSDPDFAPHGGESPRQVIARLTGCLRRIAAAHPNERVIAVAHGGALSLALAELLTPGSREWTHVMSNCAVSDLALDPPELLSFNLNAHLEGL
jgi:broad specificity phosphatase PhoE